MINLTNRPDGSNIIKKFYIQMTEIPRIDSWAKPNLQHPGIKLT